VEVGASLAAAVDEADSPGATGSACAGPVIQQVVTSAARIVETKDRVLNIYSPRGITNPAFSTTITAAIPLSLESLQR